MTSFVESCVETVADSAVQVERKSIGHGRAHKLIKVLADKKKILITTHVYPDPDAIASCIALSTLLKAKLKESKINVSIKGSVIGGMNSMFAEQSDLQLLPWEEMQLSDFDAVVLVDVQAHFANSPLPEGFEPMVVIDHHRSLHRRPKCAFCDIRSNVGATATIIFSYFMELETPISRSLGATLLYAIESDLAGSAGKPGELDNMALSSLTLIADTRKLYQMRYVDLPQNYFIAYANGINNAAYYDNVLTTHIGAIDTPEKPAIIADFLLRFEKVEWALVTARMERRLVFSLRTRAAKSSAADVMKKLVRQIGSGGGHRTKAGGSIKLSVPLDEAEVEKYRLRLRRRLLRALHIKNAKPARLMPKREET